MADETRPGAVIPAAGLVAFLLLDLLRVWLPSLLFVMAELGETSALTIGAMALGVTAVAPVLLAMTPVRAIRMSWVAGVVTLIVARVALQAVDGGVPQFVSASVGIVGASVALGALALGARSGGGARFGVLLGLTGSAAVQVGLASTDLVWRTGLGAWSATLLLLAALTVVAIQVWPELALVPGRIGAAWAWWLLGPILFLLGVLVGVPGRIAVATRWTDPLIAAVTVLLLGLIITAVLLGRWLGPSVAGPAGAGLTLVGTAGALQANTVVAVSSQASLAVGLGLVIAALDRTTSSGGHRSVGAAAAGIPLGLTVLGFAYYAGYDLVLPIPNRILLLVGGVIVAVGALVAGASRERATLRERWVVRRIARAVGTTGVVALAAAVLVAGTERGPAEVGQPGEEITVALSNIHMGFDPQGRLSIHELGDILAAEDPDIVVLNEVDRGWLTTGGRDTLRQLSGRLGLPYVFGPAADEVWGNAVLSRYPITEASVERLPRGRDAMARSQLIAAIQVTPEDQIAVVATHLSHVDQQGDTRLPQARAVAATLARLQERGVPVILAGDLNAEPGDPELAIFADATTSVLPPETPTWPSWSPEVQIDHILVTERFRLLDAGVLDTQVSDHLPVIATVELTPAPS